MNPRYELKYCNRMILRFRHLCCWRGHFAGGTRPSLHRDPDSNHTYGSILCQLSANTRPKRSRLKVWQSGGRESMRKRCTASAKHSRVSHGFWRAASSGRNATVPQREASDECITPDKNLLQSHLKPHAELDKWLARLSTGKYKCIN